MEAVIIAGAVGFMVYSVYKANSATKDYLVESQRMAKDSDHYITPTKAIPFNQAMLSVPWKETKKLPIVEHNPVLFEGVEDRRFVKLGGVYTELTPEALEYVQ